MTVPSAARLSEFTVDIASRTTPGSPLVRTLDGVNLTMRPGRLTALIGESGCGKSLIAAALCGLLPPGAQVRGQIAIDGDVIESHDERRWRGLRGRHIGMAPQSAATSFSPVRTVGSQLIEVCRRLRADRTADQLFAAVRLPADVGHQYPHELSGGMAQRAAIAAALAGRPSLLIADEPTAGLDPDNAAVVWRLLADVAAGGAGVLVITHDLPSLVRAGACDDIALMRAGAIVAHDHVDSMIASADGYVRQFFDVAMS